MLIVLSKYQRKAELGQLTKEEQLEVFNSLKSCQAFIMKIQKYLPEDKFGKNVSESSFQDSQPCVQEN